jgi:uncharacterized protein (TIGR03000 family)
MNRLRLGALALATAVVLILPSVSHAQRFRGWGGRWDRGDGVGYRTSYYYDDGTPYRYYGYGPRLFGRGYRYGPYAYDYTWGPTSYTYDQPFYRYQSAYPADSSSMTTTGRGRGVLATILLPDPNAKLWIEDQEMATGGPERRFFSPPLNPNTAYTYTFRAEWTQNGKKMDQTRQVQVAAGSRITVDFNAPERPGASGTRRQSGYGPQEGAQKPGNGEKVSTPRPKPATPPVDRPRD